MTTEFDIDPAQFAALVAEASDDQIADGLEANGELIVGEIFRRMPERLRADRVRGLSAAVEWRIRPPGDGEPLRWRVEIDDGRCRVSPGGGDEADVVYEIGGVDFIRLVSGNASGPRLFVFGRLKIRGNLMLAARMPAMFAMPQAPQAG